MQEGDITAERRTLLPLPAKLLAKMASFISSHKSTSKDTESDVGDKKANVMGCSAKYIFEMAGIALLPSLTTFEWETFTDKFSAVYSGYPERVGVHPIVQQLLETANTSKRYKVCYEARFEDQEYIIAIPDFSAYEDQRPNDSRDMINVAFHLQAKTENEIVRAAKQSEGYATVKLRDQIELTGHIQPGETVWGFALGSDGLDLSVSLVRVTEVDGAMDFQIFRSVQNKLWVRSGKPMEETPGVRILRTFFSLRPDQLGCTHRPQQFHTSVGAFNAVQVLGRGAFCTAFRAVGANHPHQEVVVKQEILTITGKDTHRNLLSHLTRELEIVRMFGSLPNSPLPRLLLPEEVVSSASPFLLMLPVGLDLIRHAALLSARERRKHAKALEADLRSCLQFAHSVGVCHSDLRPANVIALPSGRYSVIDWGLGRAPGAPLHRYKGAVPFMHDELLRALPPPCDKREVPFKAEYDIGAIQYIVWTFIHGDKGLVAPWANRWYDEHEYMIDERQKWIQEQSNNQATSKSTKKRAASRTDAGEASKRGKNSAVTVSTGPQSAKKPAARSASLHNKYMNLRSQAAVDAQERDQQHAAGDRSV